MDEKMEELTVDQLFAELNAMIRGQAPSRKAMLDLVDRLEEELDFIRKRYADNECRRLAEVVRNGMTPEEYYATVAYCQRLRPELWPESRPAYPPDANGRVVAPPA